MLGIKEVFHSDYSKDIFLIWRDPVSKEEISKNLSDFKSIDSIYDWVDYNATRQF